MLAVPKYRVLSIAVKNAIPCQELKEAADEHHHQDVRANVAEYEYTHRYDESGALNVWTSKWTLSKRQRNMVPWSTIILMVLSLILGNTVLLACEQKDRGPIGVGPSLLLRLRARCESLHGREH